MRYVKPRVFVKARDMKDVLYEEIYRGYSIHIKQGEKGFYWYIFNVDRVSDEEFPSVEMAVIDAKEWIETNLP